MNVLFGVVTALMLLFIIYQGRTVVPRIMSFLIPGNRKLYFEDSAVNPLDPARQELVRPTIEKMEALGFKPLGIMVEKQPLWAKSTREFSLASSVDKVFASIGFRRNQPSYFLYTPFKGGEVVITSYNSFRSYTKDDFVTTVVSSGEIGEMLEVHKKQVEEFTNKGYTPFDEYTQQTVIEATNLYYNASYPKQQLRVAGMFNLLFFLVCLLVFALLLRGAIGG